MKSVNKKHLCKICKKVSYKDQKTLKRHVLTDHAVEGKHACDFCLKVFKDRSTLEKHVKKAYPKKHLCDKCDKIMAPISKKNHMKTQHLGKRPCHKCDVCHKRAFVKKKDLEKHKSKCGLEEEICKHCGKDFKKANALKKHITARHTNLTKKCDKCPKMYNTDKELAQHFDYAHDDSQVFKCDICEKCFTTKANLNRHNSASHKKPKEFKCGSCEQTFEKEDVLKIHTTKLHNFKCDLCSRTFMTQEILKNHKFIFHKTEKRSKYMKCKFCPATFSDIKDVPRHAINQHRCKSCKIMQEDLQEHMLEEHKLKENVVQVNDISKHKLEENAKEIRILNDKNAMLENEIKKLKLDYEEQKNIYDFFYTLDNHPIDTTSKKSRKQKNKTTNFQIVPENCCKFCSNKPFPDQKSYMSHLKNHHKCSKCGKYVNKQRHIC